MQSPSPSWQLFPVDRPPEAASIRVPGCTAVFIGGLTDCGITDEFVGAVFEQCGPVEKVSLFPLSGLRPEAFTCSPGRVGDELWRGLRAMHRERDSTQERLYAMVKFAFVEGPVRAVRFNGATLDVIFPPPRSPAARGPQRLSFLLTVDFVNDAELHFFVPGLEPPQGASIRMQPMPSCAEQSDRRPFECVSYSADDDLRRPSAPSVNLVVPASQAQARTSLQPQSVAPGAAGAAAKSLGVDPRAYSPSRPTDSEHEVGQEAGVSGLEVASSSSCTYKQGMTLHTPDKQILVNLCDYKPLLVTEFAPRPFSHADLNILLSGLKCTVLCTVL